jgi:hypothetical protein
MPRGVKPEAELAVLLIGTEERRVRQRDQVLALLDRCDEDDLGDYLERLGVLTFAVRALNALAPDRVPPAMLTRSTRVAEVVADANTVLNEVSAAVCGELERADIPALELKGSRLAQRLHGGLKARISSDIDLLVSPEDLRSAIAICETFGFENKSAIPFGGLPEMHARLIHSTGLLPPIELHWRIHWYESEFATAMLGRTEMVDGVRQPTVEDELAALMLYYERDGFVGLRYPNDLAAWHAQFGSVIQRDVLDELCDQHPALSRSWQAANKMCHIIVGACLESTRNRDSWRADVATRFADWDFTDSSEQASVNTLAIDALCGPRETLGAWVRRALFPPVETLVGLDPAMPRFQRQAGQALHPLKMLGRLLYAAAIVAQRGHYRPLPVAAAALAPRLTE